jgi:riboflavin kinase/FMN adenylyltransferase
MELVRGFHNVRQRGGGCAVTIGNFDGVHRGHQALIARTRDLAREHGVPSCLVTFEPTPREFFSRDRQAVRISTFRGKLRDLERCGIDRVVVQRFGRDFASVDAERFVADLLVGKLGAKAVAVGDDFRFGSGRRGDLAMLQRLGAVHGFSAEGLPTLMHAGRRCSSSAVREALAAPDLALAHELLDHPYRITGHVRRGLQLGRKLGMPTTNIFLHRPPALHLGVYVVRARVGERTWSGVANIGVRPTLGITRCLLETHVLGEPGELYGQVMEVEFHRFLRDELRFDSLELLAAQMQRDKADAVAFWASQPSYFASDGGA